MIFVAFITDLISFEIIVNKNPALKLLWIYDKKQKVSLKK